MATKLPPMPGLLLDWFPGESLYSLIAREHSISGRKKAVATINHFFGMAKERGLKDGRTEMDCLMERTEGALGPIDKILKERTILRYYRPFLRQRERRLVHPGKFGGVDMLKFPLGLHTGRYLMLYPLKGCRACVEEDRTTTGMPYWRLEHQYPGVWVCLKHDQPLFRTTALPAASDRFHLVTPNVADLSEMPGHLRDPGRFQKFRCLAEFVVSITTQFEAGLDPMEDIRKRFYTFADSSGLVTGTSKLRGYHHSKVGAISRRFEHFMPTFNDAPEFGAMFPTLHIAHNYVSRYLNAESRLYPNEHLFLAAWVEFERIGA
ncbi:TniQ family protein [Duganella levis]|nr:TniQ family protein [Duganella levis]